MEKDIDEVPPQHQDRQPGIEREMEPEPRFYPLYGGVGKFTDKVVLITGGDSGIGRAVALAFANEGAKLCIVFKDEHQDAAQTKKYLDEMKASYHFIAGDLKDNDFCKSIVDKTVSVFGKLDVLINNAAVQYEATDIGDIGEEQLMDTFQTNFFSMFYITQQALKHLPNDTGNIINTTSVTAYRGSGHLIDYSSTKGAIVAFTRSLARNLVKRNIRVNAVAPGPIWTPLIPASFGKDHMPKFGKQTEMKRPGQPCEVAGCYTFLASSEASYMTGQVLHPNGGTIVGG